ncbi:uncharacterized protein BJ171DRAFT_503117 [Polychytrium aggregatum]|uniref:uncharacterized protein n=1 Tax=Polychytrium aggregatum TaxID=110093 RepID=UPI0022FECE62|nr:uncharacterized protein BJ171DRAFT_503117 [Polychytrium aggregatum]KAI9205147.1 hypothetical protein BJ171DRAFT_503117 [Polychytrium aggregatum]
MRALACPARWSARQHRHIPLCVLPPRSTLHPVWGASVRWSSPNTALQLDRRFSHSLIKSAEHDAFVEHLKRQCPSKPARIFIIGLVGMFFKLSLKLFFNVKTFHKERLIDMVSNRGERPLITVANHSSTMDDPMLFSILPTSVLLGDPDKMRWSFGAKEVVFINDLIGKFFFAGNVYPIVRGNGIFQPAMDIAVDKVQNNQWVHLFSEARINQEDEMDRFKWGVARLIMESKTPPVVVPFWHKGMVKVMPESSRIRLPRPFKTLVLAYGEPIDFKDLLPKLQGKDLAETRSNITEYIRSKMIELQRQTELQMKRDNIQA